MKLLKKTLIGLALIFTYAFLFYNLFRYFKEVEKLLFQTSPWFLLFSFVFLFLCFPINAYGWCKILHLMGIRVNLRDVLKIMGLTIGSKYIPGKIWYAGGKGLLLKEKGVSPGDSFRSVIFEVLFLILGAMGLSLLLVPYHLFPISVVLYLGMLIFLFKGGKRFLSRYFNKIYPSFLDFFYTLGIFFGVWFLQSTGFFWLTKSFYPEINLSLIPQLIGSYSFAWLVGFAVIVMPAGLGVREATSYWLLSKFLPPPVALTLSLATRLWIIIGDTLFAMLIGILTIAGRRRNR